MLNSIRNRSKAERGGVRKGLNIIFTFLLLSIYPLESFAQIGTWRNYLAYHNIQQIQATGGNDIFVLASNDLYQYNKADQSIVTYDKTNGLSDTHITHIRWCQQAKRLIAVYSNCNIDLVETNGSIINLSDIYWKTITGDKSVNNITISGQYAYLACGFGIVKLDVKKVEVSESYMLDFPVTAVALDGSNIYAKSSSTTWTAPLSSNLIDKSNWHETQTAPSFEQDNSDYEQYYPILSTLKPDGPKYNYFGFTKFDNGKLYTCGAPNYNIDQPACIQLLDNGEWQIYQDEGIKEQTGINYINVTCLDTDPRDINHMFAGSRTGLYEFRNGQFVQLYNDDNSPIEPFDDASKNYELVTGVKFDNDGNLWILNSQASTQAIIKYADGQFTSYPHPELMKLTYGNFQNRSNSKLCSLIADHQGIFWFVNDNWRLPALYSYDTQNDKITAYESFTNQDGTTISNMYGIACVVEDLEHNIWIGTDVGPFVLERSEIENGGTTFTQVKVPRNDGTNYADYLLSGVNIQSIAIDDGGRKWFGTNGNGVYLLSDDNMTQLQHFTTENSPLLSDIVKSISINHSSGEVFFGTENGLCSYMSDATATNTTMNKDNVYAYPNPVTPDYTGLITVVGLTLNADVKILSANGALVAEGRSNGGTFTWDGCDKSGRRVASGVYMVAVATSHGDKGTVCKIAVIN